MASIQPKMTESLEFILVNGGPLLGGAFSSLLCVSSPSMSWVYLTALFGYQLWVIWRFYQVKNQNTTFTSIAMLLVVLTHLHLIVHNIWASTNQYQNSMDGKDAVMHLSLTAFTALPFHFVQGLKIGDHWDDVRKFLEYVILPLMLVFVAIECTPYYGLLITQGMLGILEIPGFVFRMIAIPPALIWKGKEQKDVADVQIKPRTMNPWIAIPAFMFMGALFVGINHWSVTKDMMMPNIIGNIFVHSFPVNNVEQFQVWPEMMKVKGEGEVRVQDVKAFKKN